MCPLGQFLDLSPEFLGCGSLTLGQLKGSREPEDQPHGLDADRLARPTSRVLCQAQALAPVVWRAREQQAERRPEQGLGIIELSSKRQPLQLQCARFLSSTWLR
jgi:hypothetical protein